MSSLSVIRLQLSLLRPHLSSLGGPFFRYKNRNNVRFVDWRVHILALISLLWSLLWATLPFTLAALFAIASYCDQQPI
jgi:hypothetical protein